jgi:hypothetical protein
MSYQTEKYSRMLKAGHPKDVVLQTISVDLQCSKEDPLFQNILTWVERVSSGGSIDPIPSSFDQLAESKYQRMSQKGISGDKITYVKVFDDYNQQKRTQTGGEPVIYVYPSEVKGVGDALNDRVVNDKDMKEEIPLSKQRATELKKEAISIREEFSKADVEKVTDEEDSAPLISNHPPEITEKAQFYSYLGNRYPEPEIKREEIIPMMGVGSHQTHTSIFREHLPERMYTFLNILNPEDCRNLIRKLDFTSPEEKVQEQLIAAALNSKQSIIRTNIRRNFMDDEIARIVWCAVKSTLPAKLADGRELSGIRSKMNYYRYGEGQYFSTHIDGGFRFTETGDSSEYTFIIYLNDDFIGGTTRYCPLPEWNKEIREVKPIQGGMLIFRQSDLKHCGVTVVKGFKHILQGMVMYGPLKYNQLGKPFGKPPQLFITTTCDD